MEEIRKPQTIATEKYMKKAGIIAKKYKLKKEVAEQFAKTCKKPVRTIKFGKVQNFSADFN